jgi:hypothetical protein
MTNETSGTGQSGIRNIYKIIFVREEIPLLLPLLLSGTRLSPLGTAATTGLLYQPQMIDGGMKIGRGNRSTRRKPAPVPLCPPQIPHDLSWARNRAAAVGSQRLTVRAMVRLKGSDYFGDLGVVSRILLK